jgi:hypothetical protein
MPDPLKIVVKNKVYITPILNGEMDDLAIQIASKKGEISTLNSRLNGALADLASLQNQFMAYYIQQTGSFPS